MTREKQIEQAWLGYAIQSYHRYDEKSFKEGVKWADEHPNPYVVKRLFEFALNNTNFLIADNLDSIDWDKLVKQAMEE